MLIQCVQADFVLPGFRGAPAHPKLRFNRARKQRREWIAAASVMLQEVEDITRSPAYVLKPSVSLADYFHQVFLRMRSYALDAEGAAQAEGVIRKWFPTAQITSRPWDR